MISSSSLSISANFFRQGFDVILQIFHLLPRGLITFACRLLALHCHHQRLFAPLLLVGLPAFAVSLLLLQFLFVIRTARFSGGLPLRLRAALLLGALQLVRRHSTGHSAKKTLLIAIAALIIRV